MATEIDTRKNYAISETAPDQNIEVQGAGKFYPTDLSNEIQMLGQERQYQSKIPESFAGMVESYDDYAINAFNMEADTENKAQAEENKIQLKIAEMNMQTAAGNQVYDTLARVKSDINQKMLEVGRDGGSYEDELGTLLEENREIPELNSPYARALWNHVFTATKDRTLEQARTKDIENLQFDMQNNIYHAMSSINEEVIQGTITPAQAMDRLSIATSVYSRQLSKNRRQEMWESAWDLFVKGRAQYLGVLYANDPVNLVQSLNTLRHDAAGMKFKFLDNNNNIIKNKDGSDYYYEVGLKDTTQLSLVSSMKTAANKGATGGSKETETAKTILSNYEDAIGWDSSTKKFNLDLVKNMTDAQLDAARDEAISAMAVKGNVEGLKSLLDINVHLEAYKLFRNMGNADVANVEHIAGQILEKVDKALTNGEDLVNFAPTIKTTKGETISLESFASIYKEIKNLSGLDPNNHARAFYNSYRNVVSEYYNLARGGNKANLVDNINKNYSILGDNFAKATTTTNLVKANGEGFIENPDGFSAIRAKLRPLLNDNSKFGMERSQVSDRVINSCFNSIDVTSKSDSQKATSYLALGSMFGSEQGGGAAATRYFMNGHANDEKAQYMMAGLYASGQPQYMDKLMGIVSTKISNKELAKQIDNEFEKNNPDYTTNLTKNMTKWSIPSKYHASLLKTGMLLVQGGASIKEAESLIKANFSKPNKYMHNNQAIFMHAPAYQAWGSNDKLIENTMKSTIDSVKGAFPTIMNNHKIEFAMNESQDNFVMYANGKQVNATFNGKDAAPVVLYTPTDLKCVSNPNVASYVSSNAAAIQFMGHVAYSFDGSMKEHMKLVGIKGDMASEKKKMLANAVTARNLTVLRNVAYQEASGHHVTFDTYKGGMLQTAGSIFSNAMLLNTVHTANNLHATGVLQTGAKVINSVNSVNNKINNVHNAYQNSPVGKLNTAKQYIDKAAIQGAIRVGKEVYNTPGKILNKIDQGFKNKLKNSGINTGFAADIDNIMNAESEDLDTIYNNSRIQSIIESKSSYAGKIDQTDVSVPLSYMACGIPEYADIYNACARSGLEISESCLNGVTQPKAEYDNEIDGIPTGFAANIPAYNISKNQIPAAKSGYNYSRAEIDSIIDATCNAFGADPRLIRAMIKAESGFQQRIKSKINKNPAFNGEGLMQLLPSTAKHYGVSDTYDAQQNIWAGTKYIVSNIQNYHGNLVEALVQYNGGQDAVKAYRAGKKQGPYYYAMSIIKEAGLGGAIGGFPSEISIKHSLATNSHKFKDSDTNELSVSKINDRVWEWKNDPAYKGKLVAIYTNQEALLSNDKKYAAFAKFRSIKGADGKPLFRRSKYDGFDIRVKTEQPSWSKQSVSNVSAPAIGDDMAKTQSPLLSQITNQQGEALVRTFGDRSNNKMGLKEAFGLANLTLKEYDDYGVPMTMADNPVLQGRVLAQEFQRAQDVLGNERKAVYALAGGTMVDNSGLVKSWAEIKKDKEAFTKDWYIKPNENSQEREQANALLAQYQDELRRIRGY